MQDFFPFLSVVSGNHGVKLNREDVKAIEGLSEFHFVVIGNNANASEVIGVASSCSLWEYCKAVLVKIFLNLHLLIIIIWNRESGDY